MPKSQIHAHLLLRGQRGDAPRAQRGVLAYLLAVSSVSAVALGACATAPPSRVETVHRLSPSEEAEAIEAAKRHPIATTYERPESRTDGALPVAPPTIPAPAVPPPGAEAQAEAPPPPRDQVIIVGNEPAPATPPAAEYRWPDTSYPDASYPDASYPETADSPYVWVDGAWVARPGRVYVETPGIGVGVGVGVGRPYGYGWDGYYDHGYSYPRPYYRGPPVVVVPSRPWHSPRNRYYDSGHVRPRAYQSSPRREVYVAPRAPEVRRAPAVTSRSAPVYRAPAARPRSPAPVYRAPAARPRSSGSVHHAPRSSGSSSGGRRSVHVR